MNTPSLITGLPAPAENLLDTLHRTGHFKYLLAAIKAAGMAEVFTAAGPLTLFAPNDHAFGKLPKPVLTDLLQPTNPAWLRAVLTLHLVSGHVNAPSGDPPEHLRSVQGEALTIDRVLGLRLNHKARIVERDMAATNGVIHVIDTLLTPAAAS